jgi:rhamnosyltransferase
VNTSSKTASAAIVAIIPTHNPDMSRFMKVIASLVREVPYIIVVDDGSDYPEKIKNVLTGNVFFISLKNNTGQAHALNVGVKEALKANPEWILTLDQDTIIEEGAIASLGDLSTKNPKVGILFLSNELPHGVFLEQEIVITSGDLVRAEVSKLVKYREEFFIDQIDHDFCFKLKKAGYRILAFGGGVSLHNIGKEAKIGDSIIFYEPHERFYYLVRNSTVLFREGGLSLRVYRRQIQHWLWKLSMVEGFTVALSSLFWGLIDGWIGRLGKREKK